jgi:hypothetical protein
MAINRRRAQASTISDHKVEGDEVQVGFSFGNLSFDAIVASDFSTLKVTVRNQDGQTSDPATLTRQYSDTNHTLSTIVLTGKLNWFQYAANEMITLVIPAGVSSGAPAGLYYQWTVDGKGVSKSSLFLNTTFQSVTTQNNEAKGTIDGGYYTYEFTVPDHGDATLRMSNPSGKFVTTSLKQVDWRRGAYAAA